MGKYKFDGKGFAVDLHSKRWGRGEGVREVAENCDVSPSTVSRWENAKHEPRIVDFLVACGHYGLDPLNYILKEVTPQVALPGFEGLVGGPLVALSQQDLYTTFELLNESMSEGPEGPVGPDDSGVYGIHGQDMTDAEWELYVAGHRYSVDGE